MLVTGRAVDAQQPPRFQSGIDVVPIDVTVLDGRGQPIRDLTAGDFTVRIDGRTRRVISAEWVSSVAEHKDTIIAPLPEGYRSNAQMSGGRLIVLVIDQPNIPMGSERPLHPALNAFVDRLPASDRIAVVGFGLGARSLSFTADRETVKQAIAGMFGQQRPAGGNGSHGMGLSTALAIDRGDSRALQLIVGRDCQGNPQSMALCAREIKADAAEQVQNTRQEGEMTMLGLRQLLTGFKAVDAPKTLLLVSQGFFMDRQTDGISRVTEIASLAAAARTSIYGLKVDEELSDITQSRAPIAPVDDRQERQLGIETLTSAARGALFTISGTGTGVFDRIESELSGTYLIGAEAAERDRDGKPHPIQVDVGRRGVTVRALRTMVTATGADQTARSPRDIVMAALGAPLPLSSLRLGGMAFALRGLEPSKVQLLIHVDIGSDYPASRRLSIAHVVLDRQGSAIDGQVADTRLEPVVPGVPSPLAYAIGVGVDPGDYTVKIAVADGGLVGNLELPIHAALIDAGAVKLTELVAGGPVPPGDVLRPTIGPRVSFGTVHGYLEAYGADAASLNVTFEIAKGDREATLLSTNVPAREAGNRRALFSQMMLVQSLPPGEYRLRAIVSADGVPIKTLTRAFDIAPPADSDVIGRAATPAVIFLPVDAKDLARPFRREDALRPSTLRSFRDRIAPAATAAFDQGVAHLQKGDYADAETSLKRATQLDADGAAALVYLAVCYAAAGHDAEAASVWQNALIKGGDSPQIYEWLGDALMRRKIFGDARSVLEDASARWPSDPRFTRSLALVYAIGGNARDAVETIERSINDGPADVTALFLAVEWLFNVRRGGAVVHGRAQDLQLARTWAEQYRKANGPNQPLVQRWLEYLDKDKP